MKPYTLYAWQSSYYSGKARAYLRYKRIPYAEKPVRLWTMRTIQKRVGARVMPVVVTPEGQWLQDTSTIIDVLEQRYPDNPVVPATPVQRVAALLLEAWSDEFWLAPAMHYRWNFPENYSNSFRPEEGDNLLPGFPRLVKNRAIGQVADMLRGYLPGLGVTPSQFALIEHWTCAMLDALDTHFKDLPYLLGHQPCIGDFGLIGPLYAHLGRDPYPARELIEPRPYLKAWIMRMHEPGAANDGALLPADAVPDTLLPLFESVFGEFWPQLIATQDRVEQMLPSISPGHGFRRQLGEIRIPLSGGSFGMNARPFSLWMAQRPLDAYHALSPTGQDQVQQWLATVGGTGAMDLVIRPRLQRTALHVAPES